MAVIRGSSIGIRRVVARLFGGTRIISRATPVCMTGAAPTHAAKKGTINLDIVNSDVYRNSDGSTTWVKIVD